MTKSTHRAPVDVRSLLGGRASHETYEKNLSIGVFLASKPGARCRLERQDALIGMVINHIFLEMDLSVCADHFPPANRQHRRRSSMAASAAPICTIWRSMPQIFRRRPVGQVRARAALIRRVSTVSIARSGSDV